MIDRWTIFDRNHETRGIAAVGAFRFVWASLGIEDAARMDSGCHRDRHFAVRNLNLTADPYDAVCFAPFFGEVSELDEITGEFRIADKRGAGFFGDRSRVPDVISMAVRNQDVVNFANGRERIFS